MYKFVFFVPDTHLEGVKAAVFAAGAGRIGDYDCCSWQCTGQGQFRALAGSNPFIGEANTLELVSEYRVEMVCKDELISAVLDAFRAAHPYEEPAFDVWRLADL